MDLSVEINVMKSRVFFDFYFPLFTFHFPQRLKK